MATNATDTPTLGRTDFDAGAAYKAGAAERKRGHREFVAEFGASEVKKIWAELEAADAAEGLPPVDWFALLEACNGI